MTNLFITGGSGSLGTALLRQLTEESSPDEITVYSRDEWKQGELRKQFPYVRFMLGDVRDFDRLMLAMRGCNQVIHAAAYKQVPSTEANVDEAIATNVVGSLNVARAAVLNGVSSVVGISTDKACAPINAYGETKALMEKLFQQANEWSDETFFNCVRYGNVLGSRGSVVPLFRSQIRDGERYTITDPHMTRFWLTLDQAVDLVLDTLDPDNTLIEEGSIVVPVCPASSMLTLLRAVHHVWQAGKDDLTEKDYSVIGTRPGEKQHEQLIHYNESMHTIRPASEVADADVMSYYQVLPSTHSFRGEGFDYTSEAAVQLTVDELAEMLAENDDE